MSVEVSIPIKPKSDIKFVKIVENGDKHYGFGTRNGYDILEMLCPSPHIVVFDLQKMGRGVEVNFDERSIGVRLTTPCSTSDRDIFLYEIKTISKMAKAKEIICEDESYDISQLHCIKELVDANMESGLEFVSSINFKEHDPIEIVAAKLPIVIDSEEQAQFKNNQAAFDKYLNHKQTMNGVNMFQAPLVLDTKEKGGIWMVNVMAGRYIILPNEPKTRNPLVKANYFFVMFSDKIINYADFLKEVDTSARFDAARFVGKFTRKQLQNIFNKYPNPLEKQPKQ